jgi:hypothetical protein
VLLAAGAGAVAAAPAPAQVDLAEVLLGRWEGEVQLREKGGAAGRTLEIESVDQRNGKWVGSGRFGVTGRRAGPVDIEVDASGGRPSIRFVAAGDVTVRLELFGDKHLVGTLTTPGVSTRDNDRPIKLEKKKE